MSKVKFLIIFLCSIIFIICGILIYKSFNIDKTKHILLRETITVAQGDTLSSILLTQGLTYSEIHEIDELLKKNKNFTTLKADSDIIEIIKSKRKHIVLKITIIQSFWKRIELQKKQNKWNINIINITPDIRIVYKEGEIFDGDSFYFAGSRAGIPTNIIADVYDLLAFEMDFERDIRANQKFSVLYEEYYYKNKKTNTGNVIAVYFEAMRGNINMYRYKKTDGKVGYYDEMGNGAIKSLKRTPINNAKITSGFKINRKHPILGFTRAHKGVDFRASTGTPIPAAGSGRITIKTFNRGYGNYIKIRHNGSYETVYAHMSKFKKGVNVGTIVKQGQTIGYVGSTGMSTGPHLHYEIIKDKKHVNPLTVKLPAIDNLSIKDKENFLTIRQYLDNAKNILRKKHSLFIQYSL